MRRGAALPTTNNAAMRLIVSPSRGVWGGVSWFGFEILGYPQHFSGAAGLLKEKRLLKPFRSSESLASKRFQTLKDES